MTGRTTRRRGVKTLVGSAVILGALLAATPAHATGSVVGTDARTKEVGGALATCTPAFLGDATNIQNQIYAAEAGVGVVHGQAIYFTNKKDVFLQAMRDGIKPKDIVASIDTIAPDSALQARQYVIAAVDKAADPAAFTGSSLVGVPKNRRHKTDDDGRFQAAMAGNTLTRTHVIGRMKMNYDRSDEGIIPTFERMLGVDIPDDEASRATFRKRDLAERLFLSLAAGFSQGDGDKRCTPDGKSSHVAWLRVDTLEGTTINLRYSNPASNADAVYQIADMYYKCLAGTGSCDEARTVPVALNGDRP